MKPSARHAERDDRDTSDDHRRDPVSSSAWLSAQKGIEEARFGRAQRGRRCRSRFQDSRTDSAAAAPRIKVGRSGAANRAASMSDIATVMDHSGRGPCSRFASRWLK